MDKLGIFPPYLKEKLELINVFGVKKYLLFLLVTILECAVIFIILYSLIFLCVHKPTCGLIVVSILLILGATVLGLVEWKKRKNKREHDNKEKDLQ